MDIAKRIREGYNCTDTMTAEILNNLLSKISMLHLKISDGLASTSAPSLSLTRSLQNFTMAVNAQCAPERPFFAQFLTLSFVEAHSTKNRCIGSAHSTEEIFGERVSTVVRASSHAEEGGFACVVAECITLRTF